MTSINSLIKPGLRLDTASSFLEDVLFNSSNYFIFMGKSHEWNDDESLSFEEQLTFSISSDEINRTIRDNIVFMKKIFANDASLVIRRINWKPDTVFDQWDHQHDMREKDFYCINSENRVYKCLDNNQDSVSLVEPSGTLLYPSRTAEDGYLWKYMYTVSETTDKKFGSSEYIPVSKSVTESFYNRGAIEELGVIDGGYGYSVNAAVTVDVSLSTVTGTDGEIEIASVGPEGEIATISILDPGTDYTKGASVNISSLTGSNAEILLETDDSTGSIVGYQIINPGQGYSLTDTVEVYTGGAKIIPIISTSGSIIGTNIVDPGIGYESAPDLNIVVSSLSSANVNGMYGSNTSAVLKAIVDNGKIVLVNIEDPGTGYPQTTSTKLIISGDGAGASFEPIIDPNTGSIISAKLHSTGSGYTFASITVEGTGLDAILEPRIKPSDFSSDQNLVEQSAIDGAIYSIRVENGGSGFTLNNTSITIDGDGTGLIVHPILENDTIKRIVVDNPGTGYTYCNIQAEDSYGGGTGFVGRAILSPLNGGHGIDAERELLANTVCLFNVVKKDETTSFLTDQRFHQFGIIKNPLLLNTRKRAQDIDKPLSVIVQYDPLDHGFYSINKNDILIDKNNKTKHRVIEKDNTNGILTLQQLSSVFRSPSNEMYKEDEPFNTLNLTDIVNLPSIDKYSGRLFYVTNRSGISINDEQFFTIRSFITFDDVSKIIIDVV